MNSSFAIGIPTIKRADLLNQTLQKYIVDFPNTLIVVADNGGQQIYKHANIKVYAPAKHHDTGSRDYLAAVIFDELDYPCALFMHEDAYFGKTEAECLAYLDDNKDKDFLVCQKDCDNFFLPKKTYRRAGHFDTHFSLTYFIDNDYRYHMKQHALSYFPSGFMGAAICSGNAANDPSLDNQFATDKERYLAKWGGMPSQEIFKVAFNRRYGTDKV